MSWDQTVAGFLSDGIQFDWRKQSQGMGSVSGGRDRMVI
jgi:hypothetical protein